MIVFCFTFWLLQFINIHDSFEAKLFEVELVAHVVVCTNRLRIIVDHNCLETKCLQLIQAADTAPVELDRAADSVDT